jgi:hypothetical protein
MGIRNRGKDEKDELNDMSEDELNEYYSDGDQTTEHPDIHLIHPEDWISEHQESLLNVWMSIRHLRDTYETSLFKYATFSGFCHWAYENSIS